MTKSIERGGKLNTIAILTNPNEDEGTVFTAVRGNDNAVGRTPGEALDALTAKSKIKFSTTQVVFQDFKPDSFFPEVKRNRLSELMSHWREARDKNKVLAPEEVEELERLVDEELVAATKRAKALSIDSSASAKTRQSRSRASHLEKNHATGKPRGVGKTEKSEVFAELFEHDLLSILNMKSLLNEMTAKKGILTRREIFLLTRLLRGYSNQEIAIELGEKVARVSLDLNRIRNKIRYRLRQARKTKATSDVSPS